MIVDHMNVKQGGLLATMERKQQMMSGIPEERPAELCLEISVLDDKITAEEAELYEKRVEKRWFLKERRMTTVEELSGTDVVESGVVLEDSFWGPKRSSKAEGLSNVPSSGWKGTTEDQGKERKTMARKESVETQDYMSCQDVEETRTGASKNSAGFQTQ